MYHTDLLFQREFSLHKTSNRTWRRTGDMGARFPSSLRFNWKDKIPFSVKYIFVKRPVQKYEPQTVFQLFKMHAVNWSQNNSGILNYYLQLKKDHSVASKWSRNLASSNCSLAQNNNKYFYAFCTGLHFLLDSERVLQMWCDPENVSFFVKPWHDSDAKFLSWGSLICSPGSYFCSPLDIFAS